MEKPMDKPEIVPCIPKGVLKCSRHNPNARAAQNHSIVEDLGQTPCAMFALEVIRGNLGSKMGLIRKRANNKFCELEFKNQ